MPATCTVTPPNPLKVAHRVPKLARLGRIDLIANTNKDRTVFHLGLDQGDVFRPVHPRSDVSICFFGIGDSPSLDRRTKRSTLGEQTLRRVFTLLATVYAFRRYETTAGCRFIIKSISLPRIRIILGINILSVGRKVHDSEGLP